MKLKVLISLLILIFIAVAGGCQGSKTEATTKQLVEEVTGKRALDQGEKMKKDLADIQKKAAEKAADFQKQVGEAE